MQHGGAPFGTFAGQVAEQCDEVGPVTLMRKGGELPADPAKDATRACTGGEQRVGQVAFDRVARGQARVPAAQSGERIGVGQ